MIKSIIAELKKNQCALWLEKGELTAFISDNINNDSFRKKLIVNKKALINFLTLNNIYSKDIFYNKEIFKYKKIRYTPLSFGQERLWFIYQYENGKNVYHIAQILELSETVDLEMMKRALEYLVQRHSSLRTVYRKDRHGRNYQEVCERALSISHQNNLSLRQFRRNLRNDVNKVFDLTVDYPIRIVFYNIDLKKGDRVKNTTFLLINIHHIASDGWSTDILFRELHEIYEALLKNKPPQLALLPFQYKDFAVWQRNYLRGEVLRQQLQYWKTKLRKIEPLNFPTDYPRPKKFDYKGKKVLFCIDNEISEALKNLGKKLGCSLYSVLLSSFYILLYKYTYQEQIVVGTPIANRHYKQSENLVGFFVNSLAINQRISPEQTSEELIMSVQQNLTAAQTYQDIPFEKLIHALKVERDPSKHPLFQMMFSLQNFGQICSPHFKIADLHNYYLISPFDLSLILSNNEEGISGFISYATALFKDRTIKRFLQHYEAVLKQLAWIDNIRIKDCQILTKDEQQQILLNWNQTEVTYPRDETIQNLFERQAARTPNNVALYFEGQQLTYRELNNLANQLARYIRKTYFEQHKEELKSDTLIPLCLGRGMDMVVAMIAILKAGAAYVPIDSSSHRDRIRYILQDAGTNIILTHSSYQETIAKIISDLGQNISVIYLDTSLYKRQISTNLQSKSCSSDLAYVIYTSEASEQPRGVMVEHQSIVNLLFETVRSFEINGSTVSTQYTNIIFDSSVHEIFPCLIKGGKLVIISSQEQENIELFLQVTTNQKVTLSYLPESVLKNILKNHSDKLTQRIIYTDSCDLGSIKSIPKKLVLYNQYGVTEVSACNTRMRIRSPKDINMGKAIANTYVYVLDKEFTPVPIGVVGELYISGAGLARGYLNQVELTEQKFIPNLFASSKDIQEGYLRLYRTGDLVKWLPDGNLKYIDRNAQQSKIPELQTELEETENVLGTNLQENMICMAFAKVLKQRKITIDDDFFKMGGDSLSAIKVVSLLKDNFDINIASIFSLRTPRKLAAQLKFGDEILRKKLSEIKLKYCKNDQGIAINSNDKEKNAYLTRVQKCIVHLENKKPINTVLLTGATGFLGCNILNQILTNTDYKVIVLTRGTSLKHARARLVQKFQYYFEINLFDQFQHRVTVIKSDLEKENLGLSQQKYVELINDVDSIIHSAALTKHFGSYDIFYKANVLATIHLLEFCKLTKLKDFHYISTYSTLYDSFANHKQQICTEYDLPCDPERSKNIYCRTKLLAEHEVIKYQSYGVNGNIYRTGNLAFMNLNGRPQENIDDNAFANWLKTLELIKGLPKNFCKVDISPVDLTAKAIVLLFDKEELYNEIHHVFNPIRFDVCDCKWQQFNIELISIETFIDRILKIAEKDKDNCQITRLLDRHGWLDPSSPQKDAFQILQNKTEHILNQLDFKWTGISSAVFAKYLQYFIK